MLTTAVSRPPLHVALEDDEWKLVAALRDIPPSPLRDRMSLLIDELVAFVANPGCPEIQADGVPCSSAQMSCDRCRHMTDLLDALRERLLSA
jgi:hypothetical protein